MRRPAGLLRLSPPPCGPRDRPASPCPRSRENGRRAASVGVPLPPPRPDRPRQECFGVAFRLGLARRLPSHLGIVGRYILAFEPLNLVGRDANERADAEAAQRA